MKVRKLGYPCPRCGKELTSWDIRAGKALGYRTYQVCEDCMCAEYDKTREEFRYIMETHLGLRPCQGI